MSIRRRRGTRAIVRRATLVVVAAVVLALAVGAGPRTADTAAAAGGALDLRGPALVEALRRGGYVLYFRHAATDFSQSDTDTRNLANCRTQRNLTKAGREDARAIGRAIRALRIPTNWDISGTHTVTIGNKKPA